MESILPQKRNASTLLLLLAFSHMVTDLGQGALPVLLPFFKTAFNLTYSQVGFIVLAQNFTSSIVQPLFGYITDKVSLPWLLPLSVLMAGTGMALTGLVNSYYLLLVMIIIGGFGIAAFHPQASSTTNRISTNVARGKSMGLFSVGGNLGVAVGSLLMTYLVSLTGTLTNTLWFMVPAGITSVLFTINLKQLSDRLPQRSAAAAATNIAKKPFPWTLLGILLLFIFVRSTIASGLTTYIPLYYINHLHGDTAFASYLLTSFLAFGAFGTLAGAALSDRYGRKAILVISMLLSLPLIYIFPFTNGMISILVSGLIGFTVIFSFATTVVYAQEMMPDYVGIVSGLTLGFSLGLGGVGAALLGCLADSTNLPMVFTVLALLPLSGLVIALFLPGKVFKRQTA